MRSKYRCSFEKGKKEFYSILFIIVKVTTSTILECLGMLTPSYMIFMNALIVMAMLRNIAQLPRVSFKGLW